MYNLLLKSVISFNFPETGIQTNLPFYVLYILLHELIEHLGAALGVMFPLTKMEGKLRNNRNELHLFYLIIIHIIKIPKLSKIIWGRAGLPIKVADAYSVLVYWNYFSCPSLCSLSQFPTWVCVLVLWWRPPTTPNRTMATRSHI